MSAIDPKESARYAARLFGYFLAVTIVGGGVTAGGLVLLEDTGAMPGGAAADVGAELIVGGALTAVGVLVVLAGFFAVVLNVIADGVRYGAGETAAIDRAEPEAARAPRRVPPRERRAPGRVEPRRGRPAAGRSEPPTGGDVARETADDDSWKREVEEQLEEHDPSRQGEDTPAAGRSASQPAEDVAGEQTQVERAGAQQPPVEEEPRGGARPDRGPQAPADPTGGIDDTPDAPGEGATESTEMAGSPVADQETEADPGEEWVSGDEVATEENAVSGAGRGQEPEPSGGDDQLVPEESTEGGEGSTAETPAWAREASEDDDHE